MQNLKKGAYRRLFLFLACTFPIGLHADTACPAGQLDEIANVRYVHDGDTVHLEDGRKVRLIGINTPELARDDIPDQAFARAARDVLQAEISSHGDRIGLVYGIERQDRYKRTLAHLFTPDGGNLQARLLLQGMAVAMTHPPNVAYSECYARQEKTARCEGSGIWSKPDKAVIQAAELDSQIKGFHLVSGKVEHVSQSDKGVWIFMSELMLGIHHKDLADFDQAELLSLSGKQLTVRGWLNPKSRKEAKKKFRNGRTVKYYMRIRHPSAIEISQAGIKTKC